jgi:hypothetical protein
MRNNKVNLKKVKHIGMLIEHLNDPEQHELFLWLIRDKNRFSKFFEE